MPETPNTPSVPPSRAKRALRRAGAIAAGALLSGSTAWAALAICFADAGVFPRYVPASGFAAAALATAVLVRPRRYRALALGAAFGAVLTWYALLAPSNDRDWAPEVSVLPWAEFHGSRVTVHNVRNFDYRSEADFTPRWEERTYDLDHVRSADYILVYWGSKAIAHAIVSFGFDDGRYLAVSVETRKERGESYSALQGFFRQYELTYVIADERDVLRLRTNYRNEDVYLYQTRFTPENARAALTNYLRKANELRAKPEWYNALTTNCATSVLPHARAGGAAGRMSWEVLLSGYSARQVYRNGNLDDSVPFDELERRSRVNAAAVAADKDPEFSKRIRAGLPLPAGSAEANPGR